MIKFLTSNLKHYHIENGQKVANKIDNTNGLIDQIKMFLKSNNSILFIAADSYDNDQIDLYSKLLFDALNLSGISFKEYNVLDQRTKKNAKELVDNADFIFLSGGDTYNQNLFFNEIKLKFLLNDFKGIIMGQSAGSINMAEDVFNSPEKMEKSEPIYFKGLGLTNINIEPHFIFNTSSFEKEELYQRNTILKESLKRNIYALVDGSHILEDEKKKIIYGDAYLIKNKSIKKVCNNRNSYSITNEIKNKD